MDIKSKVKLNDGNEIPQLGYGTFQSKGVEAYQGVKDALEVGYIHIDTAAVYGNEVEVGQGIKDSGVNREDIFVTTKLWNEVRGYDETKDALEQSLLRLGLDYVDLYLIHWPNPIKYRDNWKEMNALSWQAMEDLVKEGKVKSIGVSNFQVKHLDALLESAKVIPAVNQIRAIPSDLKEETVKYCQDKDIKIEAWSPLGQGELLNNEVIVNIANKHGKTPAQVCIRWSLQEGYIPLPKSVHKQRIIENKDVYDFELTDEEMNEIKGIAQVLENNSNNPDNINY